MTASPPLWAVWTDVLWCLGIGLCIAGGRNLLELLFGDSGPVRLVLDLLGFAAAAVAVCGFAARLSASGIARWYMAAAMAAGALGWTVTVAPLLRRIVRMTLHILVFPLRWAEQTLVRPLRQRVERELWEKKQRRLHRKQVKKRKKQKKMLQNPKRILYN